MALTASIDAATRSGAVLNVSLVGAGFIGRVHAQCIAANPATRLAAVFDLDESAAGALAARHGARVAGSLGEITGSGETDAVVIASSTDSHGEIARACARAGKPFLCEKPLDTSRDAAVETVRAVRSAGVLAGIGFNRRFDRQHAELKRAVGAGEVGRMDRPAQRECGPAPAIRHRADGQPPRNSSPILGFFNKSSPFPAIAISPDTST